MSLKLTQKNYLLWEIQILSLIESQNLLNFINGDAPIPDQEVDSSDGKKVQNPDYTAWVRTDSLVKAWIAGTLSEVLVLAVGLKKSKDVRNALCAKFAQNSQA